MFYDNIRLGSSVILKKTDSKLEVVCSDHFSDIDSLVPNREVYELKESGTFCQTWRENTMLIIGSLLPTIQCSYLKKQKQLGVQ